MTVTLEQFEEAVGSLHVMTAFLDRDFNFIRVNRAYAAAAGHEPDYFAGKNHFALYPDAENEAIFRRVRDTRQPYTVRAKPFENPDQPERGTTWWDWQLHPVLEDGELFGLSLILIDVTEHVSRAIELDKTRSRLAASEAHYRSLFNSGSDAIFVLSPHQPAAPTRILEANDIACQRLGYTREELVGMQPSVFNLPGYPANAAEVIKRLTTEGQTLFETVHVSKSGQHIPTEVILRLIQLEGETRVLSVARDISERKRLEAESQRNQLHAMALLNATIESAMLLDDQYRILAVNEVAAQRLGRTAAELVGMQDIDLLPTEIALSRRKRLDEAKLKRAPVAFEDARNGYLFQINANPVVDENGDVHRFAVYARDITEQRQTEAVERLTSLVNQKSLEGVPLQEILNLICTRMTLEFDLSLAWIGRKSSDGKVHIEAHGSPAHDYIAKLRTIGVRWDDSLLGRGPTGTAIRTGTQQIRHLDDVRFSPWKEAAGDLRLKSVMAIPLILRGEVYGAFNLYSTFELKFDNPAFQQRMGLLASKICLALEMAQEQQQIKLLSTAVTSARNAVMITNAQGIIQWINPAFIELSGYSSQELVGSNPRILKSGKHDADYYGELWQTISAGKVWSADAHEKRKDGGIYTVQQTITPIMADSGEITHFVAVHEDVTAKLETQKRIQHLASHDNLTGLPNRSLFYDRMTTLMNLTKRNDAELGLIFIDLDGFKPVNDLHGHHIGDLLLQGVAQRLQACVRESDTVARFGGDEFVVILYHVEGQEGARRVAEKILLELSTPFRLQQCEVQIGASLGIAISHSGSESEDQLIQRADTAMYVAKQAGKNSFRFAP